MLACAMMIRSLALLLAFVAVPASALEVRFERIDEGVYAYIGDLGPRTADNQGLNANIGLVVTSAGAVLIDSGATLNSARIIHEGVKKVTTQPVRWVINTGGQDHRWLGNGYFKAQGAEIIAHATATTDMQSRGGDHLAGLQRLLGDGAAGTVPTLPTRLLNGDDSRLQLGGMVFDVKYRGGAHTPGDVFVWLPEKRALFAGDIVYVDRLLAVIPVSSTKAWLESFAAIEKLSPLHIIPGHGRATTVAAARSQTRDYLAAMRAHMKRAVDNGTDLEEAVRTFDTLPYVDLRNATELMPANSNRVYLEVERE